MSHTVATSAAPRHLDRFENGPLAMAKADLNNLEVWRASVGKAVERCFALAGVSQKEGSALVGRDQGQVGRWISGAERPQLDAIFAVEKLRQPFAQALAEIAGAEVEVTVRMRRSA